MQQVSIPSDDLANALVSSLTEIPFMESVTGRRRLVRLMQDTLRTFPDVRESTDARIHTIELVRACMSERGGLRALTSAISSIDPEHPASARTMRLIASASFNELLLDFERRAIGDLLVRADSENGGTDRLWWRVDLGSLLVGSAADAAVTPIEAFYRLGSRPVRREHTPAALILVQNVAQHANGILRKDLEDWSSRLANRLEIKSVD